MAEALMVGMAECKVTRSPDAVLMALGLGSCIGICAYDEQVRVAGLVHVVLPESSGHEACAGKFADTAVPLLLEEMTKLGAVVARIRVALAGGAQLFTSQSSGLRLEIGPRNAAAVTATLQQRGIPILATDLGGSVGRTVHVFPNGLVRVKTIGQGEKDLVALGGKSALQSTNTSDENTNRSLRVTLPTGVVKARVA
jgi:chemotaxis protein CheD